jgi:hypothetical protein
VDHNHAGGVNLDGVAEHFAHPDERGVEVGWEGGELPDILSDAGYFSTDPPPNRT